MGGHILICESRATITLTVGSLNFQVQVRKDLSCRAEELFLLFLVVLSSYTGLDQA